MKCSWTTRFNTMIVAARRINFTVVFCEHSLTSFAFFAVFFSCSSCILKYKRRSQRRVIDLFIESGHVEKSDFAEERKTAICYRKIVNRPSLAHYLDSPALRSAKTRSRSLKLLFFSSIRLRVFDLATLVDRDHLRSILLSRS